MEYQSFKENDTDSFSKPIISKVLKIKRNHPPSVDLKSLDNEHAKIEFLKKKQELKTTAQLFSDMINEQISTEKALSNHLSIFKSH